MLILRMPAEKRERVWLCKGGKEFFPKAWMEVEYPLTIVQIFIWVLDPLSTLYLAY
jgi:hypothetical protein